MLEDYPGQKLCIFISKNDKYEGITLYELLLEIAFNSRLSGGTVTIGDKGFFGAHDESTKLKILRSSENQPVVLEFQGKTHRIERYIERIQPMLKDGLLTRTDVRITKFSSSDEATEAYQNPVDEDQSQIFTDQAGQADTQDPQAPQAPSQEIEIDEPVVDQVFNEVSEEVDETISPEEDSKEPVDSTPEFVELDPEFSGSEDLVVEPEEAEAQPAASEHAAFDDNPDQQDKGWDAPETESEPFEEEAPVLQIAEQSETEAEQPEDGNFQMDDPQEPAESTPAAADRDEPAAEDDIDKLFDETNKDFENSFDDMLKEAQGASGTNTSADAPAEATSDNVPDERSDDKESEAATETPKTYDKNHKEEDMKNYFSELFKK